MLGIQSKNSTNKAHFEDTDNHHSMIGTLGRASIVMITSQVDVKQERQVLRAGMDCLVPRPHSAGA